MAANWSSVCGLNQAVLLSLPNRPKQYRKTWSWLQTRWNGSLPFLHRLCKMLVLDYPSESHSTLQTRWAVYFDTVRAQGPVKGTCGIMRVVLVTLCYPHWRFHTWFIEDDVSWGKEVPAYPRLKALELLKTIIASLSAVRVYGIYKSAEEAISRRALAFITTWYIATLLRNTGFVRSGWIVSMMYARKGFRHRGLSGDMISVLTCIGPRTRTHCLELAINML